MRKILAGWGFAILLLSGSLYGAAAQPDSVTKFWDNEEEMGHYFKAMSVIKESLEKAIRETALETAGSFRATSGFTAWPKPDPSQDRSEKYIFLEVGESLDPTKSRFTFSLWYTPFGRMFSFTGTSAEDETKVYHKFQTIMDPLWQIEEVTDLVQVVNLLVLQDNDCREEPLKFYKQAYADQKLKPRLFVVKSLKDHTFINSVTEASLTLFSDIRYFNGQGEKDQALFSKISQGTNSF